MMATKREIEIAKAAFSWPYGFNELPGVDEKIFHEIIDQIPHNIEAERKEFESAYDGLFCQEPEWDEEMQLYSLMEHDEAWRLWKVAKGIEE